MGHDPKGIMTEDDGDVGTLELVVWRDAALQTVRFVLPCDVCGTRSRSTPSSPREGEPMRFFRPLRSIDSTSTPALQGGNQAHGKAEAR